MKRLLAVLLACLMAVPFGIIASVGVSAEGDGTTGSTPAATKAVYLSDNGSDKNDGLSADKPKKTLTQSYAALGDEGGTIIIVGTFTHVAHFFAPAHTGTVTVKGADGNSRYVMKSNYRFFLGGPTVFDNFTLEAKNGTFMVVCLFNDFTATETFSIERAKEVVLVVGGQNDTNYKAARDFGKAKDTTVTINGGDWMEVIGGMRKGLTVPLADGSTVTKKAGDFSDYELTFNIGGTATIAKFFAFNRQVTTDLIAPGAKCTVNLRGGVITHFAGVNDQKSKRGGYGDGLTVNVYKSYDINASFNGDPNVDSNRYNGSSVFCGLSGETLYEESLIKFDRLINGTLVIEQEAYIDVIGSGKVNTETFETIKTVDAIPAPGEEAPAPEDTTAPSTKPADPTPADPALTGEAPAETTAEAPAETAAVTDAASDDAGSGNVGLIIAIAAAVVVVGAVVLVLVKKKK